MAYPYSSSSLFHRSTVLIVLRWCCVYTMRTHVRGSDRTIIMASAANNSRASILSSRYGYMTMAVHVGPTVSDLIVTQCFMNPKRTQGLRPVAYQQ